LTCIGVDPGVKTGYAVWDSKRRNFKTVRAFGFWDCIQEIELQQVAHQIDEDSNMKVYIEEPQAIKPVFGNKAEFGAAVGSMISQRVGENKCMAKLFIKFFERKGINFSAIPPKNKKIDAETFKKFTKWDDRTDQHGRDAAWLVWGR